MKNKFNNFTALSCSGLVGTICLFSTAQSASALTFVLDFNGTSQANTSDVFDIQVGDFDVTDYGFAASDFNTVTNAVLTEVKSHFQNIPDVTENVLSPLNPGEQLNIDFVIGDLGTAPSNGDSEYYFMQIGDFAADPSNVLGGSTGVLGLAAYEAARTNTGQSNQFGFSQTQLTNLALGSIFSDRISNLGVSGLKTGNLTATVNALSGTLSHEIGHTLSLEHLYKEQSVTPSGAPPIMGTGALDLPNSDRVKDREFAFTGRGEISTGGDHIPVDTALGTIEAALDMAQDPFAPVQAIPVGAPIVNEIAQLDSAINASVPFEFSPTVGLVLVGGTFGFVSLRRKALSSKL